MGKMPHLETEMIRKIFQRFKSGDYKGFSNDNSSQIYMLPSLELSVLVKKYDNYLRIIIQ